MTRKFIVLIAVAAVVSAVLVLQDFATFNDGGRPKSSFLENVFSMFLHHRRDYNILRIPLTSKSVEVYVSHRWRGKYQFYLWVPDEIADCSPVSEIMGVKFEITDDKGEKVYSYEEEPKRYAFWFKDPVAMGDGSVRSVCVYYTPNDAPLDELCRMKITLTGDVDKFLENHHVVHLVLQKERDK
jgi:hypothetical protein